MTPDRAVVALLLAGIALVAAALSAPGAGRWWGFFDALGLASLLVCLALVAWPLRPRAAPSVAALPLARHRLFGLLALALGSAHALGLLAVEPLLSEHLLPTAPPVMQAGTVALGALGFLCVAGLWPVRRHFQSAGAFQLGHITASVLLLVLLAVHALGATRYLSTPVSRGALILSLTVAALVVLRPRRHGRSGVPGRSALARLAADCVSARHGRALVALVLTGVLALLACQLPAVSSGFATPVLRRTATVPLSFPHESHRAVSCVTCHHNFTDHTGSGTCIACHRATNTGIKLAAEPRFHAFCEGCHAERAAALHKRGPLRACQGCHALAVAGSGGG